MIENAGGKVIAGYYAFGPHDVVLIAEMADNTAAAAFSIAVAAAGAAKVQATPLMTPEEGLQAIRAAGSTGYRPRPRTGVRPCPYGRATRGWVLASLVDAARAVRPERRELAVRASGVC